MRIDLHCHSNRSDGALPWQDVAARAASADLAYFSLTDHDTLSPEELPAELPGSVRVLRGCELSCMFENTLVHLLVYGSFASDWQPLDEICALQRNARKERVLEIAARLLQRGVNLDPAELLRAAETRAVGRPDIARELVKQEQVRSVAIAFQRYLGDDAPCNVRLQQLELARAVSTCSEAGLCVSLAHPHTAGAAIGQIFDTCQPLGLRAIEARYGSYNADQQERWLKWAHDRHLVVTGGSDFHGATYGGLPRLGIEFPNDELDILAEWLCA